MEGTHYGLMIDGIAEAEVGPGCHRSGRSSPASCPLPPFSCSPSAVIGAVLAL